VWGADPVATETVATGKSFVVACWTGSKYVALPHFTTGSTPAGTNITVNASGKVTTADAPEWTFTKNPSNANQFYLTYTSSGTTYYLYKNGTNSSNYNIAGKNIDDKNYWTFTKSGSAYNVIAVDRGTNNTRLTYYVSGSKWEVYGTAETADIILLEKASACTSWSDPTVTYSATTLTAGGAHATISVSGTTYGTRTFSSSDDDILTVNSTTGEVTPVSNGNASVTVSWAGNATYCSKDVVINFTVNKASATIKLSEAGAESTVSGTHYSGDSYTLPTSTEATCGTKVLVGWSTTAVAETDTKPTSNFYEKGESVTLSAGENKFYAVFATASAGATTITKMVYGDDFEAGDNIIIVAENTKLALYQETTNTSWVSNWTFTGDVPVVADIDDEKKYLTVSAGDNEDTWKLGDATNGYLYTNTDNELYCSTTNHSNWELISYDDGTFRLTAERCLSCRTDLSSSNKNLWRGGGSSCGNGTTYYNIYKYGGGTTYSAYSTSCEACTANPTIGTAQLKGSFSLSNFWCSCRF